MALVLEVMQCRHTKIREPYQNSHGRLYWSLMLETFLLLQRSFNKAVEWVKELKQQANAQIVMVLAGNKADMASEKRAVSREVCTSASC